MTQSAPLWIYLNPNANCPNEKQLQKLAAANKEDTSPANVVVLRSMSDFFDFFPQIPDFNPDKPEAIPPLFFLSPLFLGSEQRADALGNAFLEALTDQPRFSLTPFLVLSSHSASLSGVVVDPPAPARIFELPDSRQEFDAGISQHIQLRRADCVEKFNQGCAIVLDKNLAQRRQICVYLEQTNFGPVYGLEDPNQLQTLLLYQNCEPGIVILALDPDSRPQQAIIRWMRRNVTFAGTSILGVRPSERKLEADLPQNLFAYPPDLLIGRPIRPLTLFKAATDASTKPVEVKQFQRTIAKGYQSLDRGNAAEARSAFQKAEGLIPGQAESVFGIGLSYSLAGETTTALEYFQKSLHIRPQFEEAILAFASQLFKLSYVEEAFELLFEGQSKMSRSVEIPLLGAKKAIERQRPSYAQRFIKRLKILAPEHPDLEGLESAATPVGGAKSGARKRSA